MVDPVPAATILLLRDNPTADADCEVFMVVRHHQIDFASGALVFPGGRIDDGDSEVTAHCDGAEGLDAFEIAMRVGAIREAFEESGVLLARPVGEQAMISAERCLELTPYRDQLNQGDLSLKSFLEQQNLQLACDVLTPFAHWITPDMMPKRFDTHFYVTRVPESQVAEHDGTESVDSVWISADDALAGAKDGRYTVIFPTRLNIELLADSGSTTNQVIDTSATRDIVPVLPVTEKREDGTYICIPANAGYRVSEEKMERGA